MRPRSKGRRGGWSVSAWMAAVPLALAVSAAAHAERICAADPPPGADPAVTVSLHLSDDGIVRWGEIHWALPGPAPGQPSMVHVVYPLVTDHAARRPSSVITLNVVGPDDIRRSPTASVELVVDGMDAAVRAWDLYAKAVAELSARPAQAGSTAQFVGAVPFTPTFQDGRRDTDSSSLLSRIGDGAHTLEVRLLGGDGTVIQDHSYRLYDTPAPPPARVQAALAASLDLARDPAKCPAY